MTDHIHDDERRSLVHMIDALTELVRDLHLHRKLDIIIQGQHDLMATLAQFVAAQTAFNTRLDAATSVVATGIASVQASVSGIAGDVAHLKDLIEQLQASQGQLTAEDQALLDQLQASAEAATIRLESAATTIGAVAAGAQALDDMTPPPAPPTT